MPRAIAECLPPSISSDETAESRTLKAIIGQFACKAPTTPAGPLSSSIDSDGKAVTVFAAGSIVNVADIINPTSASESLYVDIVGPPIPGSATTIELHPGQAYRVSGPITTPVTAVAATAGHTFVAVRY